MNVWFRSCVFASALLSASFSSATPRKAPSSTDGRVIEVTGAAEIAVEPDQAEVRLSVVTTAATAAEASAQNSERVEKVISALRRQGVPALDIDTHGYSLIRDYEHESNGRQVAAGYRVTNSLLVRTTKLTELGELMDVAVRAGANEVLDVRFSVSDPAAAHRRAVGVAVRNASESAKVLAVALGVHLGPIQWVRTAPPPDVRPEPFAVRGAALSAPSTGIRPSEQTFTAHVTLAFAIAPGS